MKKLQRAISALTLSLATILSVVSCVDSNNRDYYYDNNSYPYTGPQYVIIRAPSNGKGRAEYLELDKPVTQPSDVTRFDNARYKPMSAKQAIDQKVGYNNVDAASENMYFVQHNPSSYVNPQSGAAKQTTYWWSTGYGCGTNVGYWNYASYCGYGNYSWNHYYAPYSYSWYYNWSWAPTYYYNSSFWYYSPGWSNYYTWGGYNYYYFNMRFW